MLFIDFVEFLSTQLAKHVNLGYMCLDLLIVVTFYKPVFIILFFFYYFVDIVEQLKFEDGAGSIKINGFQYELQQLHWHSPSEHTVNGRR